MKKSSHVLYLILILILPSAACTQQVSSAANTIIAYNQALVEKNADQLSALACSAWEADAKTELDSFSAVTVQLENQSCQESGKDGDITLVSCTGKIVANYGNEILEINLAERTYQAVMEGGDWRMCGYR